MSILNEKHKKARDIHPNPLLSSQSNTRTHLFHKIFQNFLLVLTLCGMLFLAIDYYSSHSKTFTAVPDTLTDISNPVEKASLPSDNLSLLRAQIAQPESEALGKYSDTLSSNQLSKHQAEELIHFTISHWPENDASYLAASRYYIKKNKFNKALNIMSWRPNDIVKHLEYYGYLAFLNLKTSHHEDAIDLYSTLSSIEHSNPKWWLGLAIAYDNIENYEQADFAWKKAKHYAKTTAEYMPIIKSRLQQKDTLA